MGVRNLGRGLLAGGCGCRIYPEERGGVERRGGGLKGGGGGLKGGGRGLRGKGC